MIFFMSTFLWLYRILQLACFEFAEKSNIGSQNFNFGIWCFNQKAGRVLRTVTDQPGLSSGCFTQEDKQNTVGDREKLARVQSAAAMHIIEAANQIKDHSQDTLEQWAAHAQQVVRCIDIEYCIEFYCPYLVI